MTNKIKFLFSLFGIFAIVSCGSPETNKQSPEIKIPPPTKKIEKVEKKQNNKKNYPQIQLPGNIEKTPNVTEPEIIAKKKKSYVYYKPVSIKPSEKPAEKPTENSIAPEVTFSDVPAKPAVKPAVKPKNRPDLTQKLIKQ